MSKESFNQAPKPKSRNRIFKSLEGIQLKRLQDCKGSIDASKLLKSRNGISGSRLKRIQEEPNEERNLLRQKKNLKFQHKYFKQQNRATNKEKGKYKGLKLICTKPGRISIPKLPKPAPLAQIPQASLKETVKACNLPPKLPKNTTFKNTPKGDLNVIRPMDTLKTDLSNKGNNSSMKPNGIVIRNSRLLKEMERSPTI